jgi:hypothetical protein
MLKKKKSDFSPICFRVSPDERAELERKAGSMTISAFIRWSIFGDDATPRKRRVKRPIKDYRILAQLFALIKQTQCWNNLNQIARGINSNTWIVTPETEKLLQDACKAIIEIRSMLMKALGLNESDRS